MKIESREGKEERRILTGMIVNGQVLGRIHGRYEKGLFESPWANLIAGWCIKHYEKYRKPPKADIEVLFDKWAPRQTHDKATVEIVGKFLGELSDEYANGKRINVDHLMDRAGTFFNKVRIKRLSSDISESIEAGDLERAQSFVDKFRHLELNADEFTDPYTQLDIHERAFEHNVEQVITYPGPVGDFYRDQLARECFLVLQAPMKRTKSFWLFDMVHRAVQQRRRVCYFQIGDMSESQITRRQQARLCNRPLRAMKYHYPIRLKSRTTGYSLKRSTKITTRGLTIKDIERAQKRFREEFTKSRKSYLRQLVQPTMSVTDIKTRLMRLQDTEDFVPDVIVVDYADLLQAPKGIKEKRDQINENWKELRQIALEKHALVVTATQANAKAHKLERQGRSSFSDNQLKQAHVTCMVGINANEQEMRDGIARLELIVAREGPHPEGFQVYTANCLPLANPCVRSCYYKR